MSLRFKMLHFRQGNNTRKRFALKIIVNICCEKGCRIFKVINRSFVFAIFNELR